MLVLLDIDSLWVDMLWFVVRVRPGSCDFRFSVVCLCFESYRFIASDMFLLFSLCVIVFVFCSVL